MKQNIPYKFNPFPIYYKGGSIEPPVPVVGDSLTFIGKDASNAVALSAVGAPCAIVLDYSKNGGAWTAYTVGDIIELNQNETVAFSGNNEYISNGADPETFYWYYHKFVMTGSIEASGNIQSLVNFSDNVSGYGYYKLFADCTSLLTAPQLPASGFGGYEYMFAGCSNLTTPPALPASTLPDYCYRGMFEHCTSLTAAPQLPATGLSYNCYESMFRFCSSLSTAPILPATELEWQCYQSMFEGCTSLTTPPVLSVSSRISYYAYASMFAGCTSLTAAPQLPATNLVDGCYNNMFAGCTSLSTAPALPARTLAPYCYYSMFYGCSSLSTAPALYATVVAEGCYGQMFYNCTNLSSIEVAFTDWTYNNESISYQWVYNVAPNGRFTKPVSLSATYGISNIPPGWIIVQKEEIIPLTFTGKSASNAVALSSIGSPSAISLQYSKNNGSWTNYTINDIIQLNQNETVAFSGNNNHFSSNEYNCYKFVMTGSIEASGNIQSLMNFENTLSYYCYDSLFKNCVSLTKAPQLPATSMTPYCYHWMFNSCSSLSTAPTLPATLLAEGCYMNMFMECFSLTAAPYLPATGLANYCYKQMFYNCTHLSSINVSFTDWSGATNATQNWVGGLPGLPASGTFYKPTALSTAYGASYIPTNWTVIQPPAPYEPLTIQVGDDSTFSIVPVIAPEDSILEPVTLYYSKNGSIWTSYTVGTEINLVDGDTLALSGTTEYFSKGNDSDAYEIHISSNSDTVKVYGHLNSLINGIDNLPDYAFARGFCFQTSICDASELILPSGYSQSCYEYLFFGCSALSAAPVLPNGTLAFKSYRNTFYSCSNLNTLTAYFTNWGQEEDYTFQQWLGGRGFDEPGTFYKTTALAEYLSDSDGIPQSWTVVNIDQ